MWRVVTPCDQWLTHLFAQLALGLYAPCWVYELFRVLVSHVSDVLMNKESLTFLKPKFHYASTVAWYLMCPNISIFNYGTQAHGMVFIDSLQLVLVALCFNDPSSMLLLLQLRLPASEAALWTRVFSMCQKLHALYIICNMVYYLLTLESTVGGL